MSKTDSWEGACPDTLRPITGKLMLNIFVRKTDENSHYKVGPGILFVLLGWEEQEPLKLARIRLSSLTILMLWLLTSHAQDRAQGVVLHRHSLFKTGSDSTEIIPTQLHFNTQPAFLPEGALPTASWGLTATSCSITTSSAWDVFSVPPLSPQQEGDCCKRWSILCSAACLNNSK